MKFKLNKEEKNAIRCLKNLAKRWPETLWLYAASGSLNVMRCGEDGEPVYNSHEAGGGTNQDYSITTIDIPNDGGDW